MNEHERSPDGQSEQDVYEQIMARQTGGRKVDLDRGITLRANGKSGQRVAMYKDTPGEWFSYPDGEPVTEEEAKAAGFPTDELGRERLKRERLAVAAQAIDAELHAERPDRTVIAEQDGFSVLALGLGRHVVTAASGQNLTPSPVTADQAMKLLAALTGREGAEASSG